MLSIDNSIFIQIGSFLVFCFILKRLLFDRFSLVLEERRALTEGRQKKAGELLGEAERLREEWTRRMDEAKREVAIQKEESRRRSLEEGEKILRSAREESEGMLMDARHAIQEEMDRVRTPLWREAQALSLEIVEKVLG